MDRAPEPEDRIQGIARIRRETGLGVKEAKDLYDKQHPLPRDPRDVERADHVAAVALLDTSALLDQLADTARALAGDVRRNPPPSLDDRLIRHEALAAIEGLLICSPPWAVD
jgi:hypothetical protein